MPRHVRNFWVEGEIDDRVSPLSGGPRSRNGGLHMQVYQRDEGEVEHVLTIRCWARNGELTTLVTDEKGLEVFKHVSRRDAPPRPRVRPDAVHDWSDAHVMEFGRLTPEELDARIEEVLNG